MNIFGATDAGTVRSSNQDAFKNTVLDNETVLSVVCDGMGGANAGNIASDIAVNTITNYIVKSFLPQMGSVALENLLRAAISSANIEIYSAAQNNELFSGMGTTAVVAIVKHNTAFIAHVGDSRAYLVDDGGLVQITRDHSMVQNLVEEGQLTATEAKTHPRKNVITRAVGVLDDVQADFNEVDVNGKILLICSDGLIGAVEPEDIKNITLNNNISDVPENLIEFANKNGSNDNVTVTVVTM